MDPGYIKNSISSEIEFSFILLQVLLAQKEVLTQTLQTEPSYGRVLVRIREELETHKRRVAKLEASIQVQIPHFNREPFYLADFSLDPNPIIDYPCH